MNNTLSITGSSQNIQSIHSFPNNAENGIVITFTSELGTVKVCLPSGSTLNSPDINDTATLALWWNEEAKCPSLSLSTPRIPSTLAELESEGFFTCINTGRWVIEQAKQMVGII